MNRCRWCTTQLETASHFCSPECAHAAAEMPEMMQRVAPVAPPTPPAKRLAAPRRPLSFGLGVLVTLGGVFGYNLAASTCPPPQPVPQTPCILVEAPLVPVQQPNIAPAPTVTAWAAVKTPGGLSEREIEMRIGQYAHAFTAIYTEALAHDPSIFGETTLEISIAANGEVEWVSRLGREFSTNIEPKLIKTLHRINFPRSVSAYNQETAQSTTARITFQFIQ